MRRFTYGLILAGLPLFLTACQQSTQEAAEDVREAQEDAAARMAARERDVQDAAKEGQDAVIEEQRDLQDTARAEQEKILNEQRELEDARRREAERDNPERY
jgi:hypothetical protein